MTSVLITGVARGIGYELVHSALRSGARVYGSVRSLDEADNLAKKFGGNFKPLIFDVRDYAGIADAMDEIEQLDILINNAGIIGPDDASTEDASIDKFARVFEVNTFAPLKLAHIVLPKLKSSANARIISISSQMSWMGYAKSDHIAYRASKAALNKIMQGLATDLKPQNIPVCVVDPGWVKTDMGGPRADHEPNEVAQGIWEISQNLSLEQTGKFMQWTGEEREY